MKNEITRVKILIEHILESIHLIEQYIARTDKRSFLKHAQLQDAAIRRIAIIGEAIKHIPIQIKRAYPDVPWKDIAGMRDILIHEYFDVDMRATWETIVSDIPELKRKLEQIYIDLNKK